jgi:hypothetical protein
VAEFGYTPPLQLAGLAGAQRTSLWRSVRRLVERDALSLSMRALGQLGQGRWRHHVPASRDRERRCRAGIRSTAAPLRRTRSRRTYYGVDATLGWGAGDWKVYGSAGIVRARLDVQVDAFVALTHDRTRISSNGNLRWLTFGARYGFDPRASVAVEMLYVPLDVRRPPEAPSVGDPLWSVRGQFRYAFN